MEVLIDDEVSSNVINRHTSPGIVGRLMGLDPMPLFGVHSRSTCNGNHSQHMSPGSCIGKYAFSGDVLRRGSTDEMPEFKDVFEVMEATRKKNQSPKTRNSSNCSGLGKVNSTDLNFLRQKFMDAKRLSTDESSQRSKEFNNALEALVSNKNLLLEFLQESNNTVTNELSDLICSPSSGVNRITVLRPSRRNKFTDVDVIYPPEEDREWCFHTHKEVKHSQREPYNNKFSGQPPEEDIGLFRQKLSRPIYRDCNCNGNHISATRIIVLKPCLEITQNMEGAFPLTHNMFHSCYKRTKECLHDIRRPSAEESMPQMSTGDSDVLSYRGNGPREIAQEVTSQMKRAVKRGISGKETLNPDPGMFNQADQVSVLSSMAKLKCSEAFQRSSVLFAASNASRSGSSPTYSTRKSIRKEAIRRLSDRWKTNQQNEHPPEDACAFSTLGDMLALSDIEVSKFTSGSAPYRKCPKGELHRDGMPGSCSYPLGISSNDGWKDESVCNLTTLKSVSSLSINRGIPKLSSKESCKQSEFSMANDIIRVGADNSDGAHHSRSRRSLFKSSTFHCDGSDVPYQDEAESVVTEHEIHLNFEEPTCNVTVPELSEAGEKLVQTANSNHKLGSEYCLDACSAAQERIDEVQASSAQNNIMEQEPTSAFDDHLVGPSFSDSATHVEGNAYDQREDDQSPSSSLGELVSHVSSNEDDQGSPVSVLESSLDAEVSYSGGFERISADLQELRTQLRLLKMEATDDVHEIEPVLLSDDETAASCEPLSEIGLTSCTFWDEDERDFSYVVDMLTCLGVQSAKQDRLLDACCLSEFPAGSDVYSILEKKYSKLILWPHAERSLLFDLINGALVDIITFLAHSGNQGLVKKFQLKWGKEGLVEEVWERVYRQRQEAGCFQEEKLMGVGWLDCEDVTDEIAREIAGMLDEDLLEEVIADL